MNRSITIGLSMLAGAALGAAAIQGLHAQSKPPVYYISEIDITNLDAYTKDYAPKAQALTRSMGGRLLAASQTITAFEGAAPRTRVTISAWDSFDKVQAWRNSSEYKELRKTGDQYAKFRAFAIEGLPQ